MLAFHTQPFNHPEVKPEPAGTPNVIMEEHSSISVYLHGQLQTDLEFDIAYLHDGTLQLPRYSSTLTEACLVWNHNTRTWMPATLRMWRSKCNTRIIGFITNPSDEQAEAEATHRQQQRVSWV